MGLGQIYATRRCSAGLFRMIDLAIVMATEKSMALVMHAFGQTLKPLK